MNSHEPAHDQQPAPTIVHEPAGGNKLLPVLGPMTAISLVIGEVIGSGVFIKPRQVAEFTGGYVGLILSLWVLCGLVNLCGALTISELSAMYPHAGGTYVFLRETYGRMWGFLWGWAEFWVIRSGAIAALATAMSIALEQSLGLAPLEGDLRSTWFQKGTAIGVIALLATVNVIGTRWGAGVQVLSTAVKVASLAFLGSLPFFAAERSTVTWNPLFPAGDEWGKLTSIGAALAGIMWAYDGWGQVTVVAEEIRNPKRNVPRALGMGVVLLILLYVGANAGYHWTLPSSAIEKANIPAVAVGEKLFPEWGRAMVLAMIVVSTFGALNSNILVGPRVAFAVARDNPALGPLRRIDPRTGTPAISIIALSSWAILLILAGGLSPDPKTQLFDLLTNYAIFGGSLFYFAAVCGVFILRRRLPDAPRPYRTWGYPVVPAIFVVFYIFFLASMFYAARFEALCGLAGIASGIIVYQAFVRRKEPDLPSQVRP